MVSLVSVHPLLVNGQYFCAMIVDGIAYSSFHMNNCYLCRQSTQEWGQLLNMQYYILRWYLTSFLIKIYNHPFLDFTVYLTLFLFFYCVYG